MAVLARKTFIQFGSTGPTTAFGQFGSKVFGRPQTSQDPAVLQQLSAWVTGWQAAIVSGDKAAYYQDMNGYCFVISYMLAYLYQAGIPEWDSATTYTLNSIVRVADQKFRSLQTNSTGNAPPTGASNAFWEWVNPPAVQDASLTVNAIPKVSVEAAAGVNPAKLAPSNVSDDGNFVIINKPLKFPDGTTQATTAATVAQQRTANPWIGTPVENRVLGTVYQNNTAKAIFVNVIVNLGGAGGTSTAYCDTNTNPTTKVAGVYAVTTATSYTMNMFFVVPPGFYYKVAAGVIANWIEWA